MAKYHDLGNRSMQIVIEENTDNDTNIYFDYLRRIKIDDLNDVQRLENLFSSHEKHTNTQTIPNIPNFPLDHIYECANTNCIFSRRNTKLRTIYENKLLAHVKNSNNVNILFYGSYMLFQELKIIMSCGNKLKEIHFTDTVYKNFSTDSYNKFNIAFCQLSSYIKSHGIDAKIYLHRDPNILKRNKYLSGRFDIISGIDVDFSTHTHNNRDLILEIAKNTLKIDGKILISQAFVDMVDIALYQMDANNNLYEAFADEFVRPHFYNRYYFENKVGKALYVLTTCSFLPYFLHSLCQNTYRCLVDKNFETKHLMASSMASMGVVMCVIGIKCISCLNKYSKNIQNMKKVYKSSSDSISI